MSGPFVPGDVVVCINDEDCRVVGTRCPYKKGAIYRVSDIKSCSDLSGRPATGIKTTHYSASYWNVTQFERLPKADDQFIADMRAIKPVRKEVRV